MSKDGDARKIAADLDAVLDKLAASVAALNEILTRPAPPQQAADERLVTP